MVKVGDGHCNGGVGGTGEYKCLLNGTCNEGGEPLRSPTETGTGCPGAAEYLLCEESTTITEASCKDACEGDADCVGFLITSHVAKQSGRCELHTKAVSDVALPLECYTREQDTFTLIGKGACRTKTVTAEGPQAGTHYGHMEVAWVDSLSSCEQNCVDKSGGCVGVEYHQTATHEGKHKCELHMEELSADEMSTFQCFAMDAKCQLFNCESSRKAGADSIACPDAGCSEAACCESQANVDGALHASLLWPLALAVIMWVTPLVL